MKNQEMQEIMQKKEEMMEQKRTILDYDTVALDLEKDAVIILDQTKLPGTAELIELHTAQEIWEAIYLLKVRGAPAIGVCAAFGIFLLANRIQTEERKQRLIDSQDEIDRIMQAKNEYME